MTQQYMQAVTLSGYGKPEDVLKLSSIPRPVPGPGEVLVKVHATAVNDWDWCYVRGQPLPYRLFFGIFKPKIEILGAEFSGSIEAVGSKVQRFKVGDAVYGDISESGFGGFAEYLSVTEDSLSHKPDKMTHLQATSLSHASMLALQSLVDIGQIKSGEKLLVNGAGGGVGQFAIQIAKQFDAEVTGVDSESKLRTLKNLGYHHTVDYRREDFTKGERKYDLILDTKTNRFPFAYTRSLKPNGRYVSVGGKIGKLLLLLIFSFFISKILGKKMQIVALKPNKDLEYMNQLYIKQGLEFSIDGPYELQEVPFAIRRFGEAKHIGKVVITLVKQGNQTNKRMQSD